MPLSVSPSAATPALRSSASGLAAFAVPSATATAFALTPTPVLNGLKTAASPIPLNSVAGSTLPAAAADGAVRAKIAGAAKAFETQFLSVMIGQMFEGVDTPAPFGGGSGEKAFKSFLTDAFARSIADHGGVGLAAPVARSMLKLRGLSA